MADYRIEPQADSFAAIDPYGEANLLATEEAMQDGRKLLSAKMLVETAIQEHSKMCSLDRETAMHWIRTAMGMTG